MRVTTISSRDLDIKDWRAEHYMPARPTDIIAAKLTGFTSGASGRDLNPRGQWMKHGREEVRKAYQEGHAMGTQSRAEYLSTLGGRRGGALR